MAVGGHLGPAKPEMVPGFPPRHPEILKFGLDAHVCESSSWAGLVDGKLRYKYGKSYTDIYVYIWGSRIVLSGPKHYSTCREAIIDL